MWARRHPRKARPEVAMYWWQIRNLGLRLKKGPLITDDYNPVEAFGLPAFVDIRRGLLEHESNMLAY